MYRRSSQFINGAPANEWMPERDNNTVLVER